MSKFCFGKFGVFCALAFLASCGEDGSSNADSQDNVGELPESVDSSFVLPPRQDTLRDTAGTLDSSWVFRLDTNRVIGYDTVAKEKHDTIAKVDPDTSTAAVDSTMLTDVSVSGSFGYGILDNRNGVAVQSLDETFKKVVATFPANVAVQGTYTVPKANFRPPYARAIYSGTATDLVHGKTMMLNDTLRALVSVQGGAGLANINVLTFLKSAYMQSQLQSPGAEAGRASQTASSAVWNMFHFEAANLVHVDSIKSFADGESGAALLAATILMQAVSGDADANIWKVAADFEDGSWDDDAARAKAADWALGADADNGFVVVHNNVEKLGLAAVPDFEKYLRIFYQTELGIPSCSEANEGQIVYSTNDASRFYASQYSDVSVTADRIICDTEAGGWQLALDREKDTYEMGKGSSGEIRQGRINAGILYRYNATSGNWRAVSSAVDINAYFVEKSNITDFVDVKEVYESVKDDERVIFLLRHGERDKDATSKNSGLTKAGIDSAKSMGAKLTKFDEPMRLGASEFYRAQQTVIAIAQGRGQDTTVADTFPELNDDWYMIDRSLVNQAESEAGGGWEATSYYTYTGRYSGDTAKIQAYYNLEERSAELIEILLNKYENEPDRFIMLSSHDKLMVPFVAYCSKLRINMNIKKGGTWINYLAGIAIIWDKSGNRRYVAFKGLKNAYFQGW